MLKIAYYELKKLWRDKRSFILILVQPILMVILMGSATLYNPREIKVAVFDKSDNQYSWEIINDLRREKDLKIEVLRSEEQVRQRVGEDKCRGGIIVDIAKVEGQIEGKIEFISNSTVPEISGQAKLLAVEATTDTLTNFAKENIKDKVRTEGKLQSDKVQAEMDGKLQELQSNLVKLSLSSAQMTALNNQFEDILQIDLAGFENLDAEGRQITLEETKNTTKKIKYFDFYASAVVMLLVLLTCLNMSSTSVTQERVDGTFERLFVTPYTKTQVIMGKMMTFSILSLLISFVTIGSLYFLYDATIGNFWLVTLVTYLTSLSATAIGLLVSSFTKTIAEAIQVSITIFFASLILTQFIFQVETMHAFLAKITWFVPFTYSMRSLREINLLNVGFLDVWQDVAILAASVVLFISLAVIFLHRKAN